MKRIVATTLPLALGLISMAGCRASYSSKPPEVASDAEESLVGAEATYEDEEDLEQSLDEEFGKLPELPEVKEPVKKCKGKGKNKKCGLTDPTPEVTAAHATRKFMKGYRWGMSPERALKQLSQEIEEEYAKRQKDAAGDAVKQDANREWKRAAIDELALNHIKFEERAKHKWGVSLIQFDYEDDANEEMVWVRANANLKKFYFFKDGELWKVLYAYSQDAWPGKTHAEVVEENFKKWFGVSPEEKVKQHPETQAPILRYLEWKTSDGDIVRAFDQTPVHGVHVLAFISGEAERSIGERLPNVKEERAFDEDVTEVMGASDVCYDESGNLIEDAQKCAELMGMDSEEE